MVYSLRLKLQILSALSVLLLDKPLLFVTSHLFEEGKKKVCSTFLLVEMNYHVVSSTNSFSHNFLRACLPPHLGHKCLPPVTLIKTPWPWDKFLLFHMLLLWFGLFLWVCKDENSLHRACKPSNEKGETQRKNIFRKREEEKIIMVQLQMRLCLTWAAGQFWSWGLWKKPWVVRMPQDPQLSAWTSSMPKDGQWGLSLSSLPSIPSMACISCWGWRGCVPQYWDGCFRDVCS